MKTFKYYKPSTVNEVNAHLEVYKNKAHILNGGTDLITRMKNDITYAEVVIDIKDIKDLHEISFSKENGLYIGACVTLTDLMESPYINNYKLLKDALETLGSVQIRNRATLVGNICNASPLADTATPLLVLGASVHISSTNIHHKVDIDDFFVSVRKTCLKENEFVLGVSIPFYDDSMLYEFHKTSRRKEVDLSTVCFSIMNYSGKYKIALGAVAPRPIRAKLAEEYLNSTAYLEENLDQVLELVLKDISPISDVRASKEYRIDIVKVLVERGLKGIERSK